MVVGTLRAGVVANRMTQVVDVGVVEVVAMMEEASRTSKQTGEVEVKQEEEHGEQGAASTFRLRGEVKMGLLTRTISAVRTTKVALIATGIQLVEAIKVLVANLVEAVKLLVVNPVVAAKLVKISNPVVAASLVQVSSPAGVAKSINMTKAAEGVVADVMSVSEGSVEDTVGVHKDPLSIILPQDPTKDMVL